MAAAASAAKAAIDTPIPGPQRHITGPQALRWLLGAPALLPAVFLVPGIFAALVTGNGATVHTAGNDVLGTGGALLLFAMLGITPLQTLTRHRWFVPLRRWYGVVFGGTIFLDAALASNDPAFNGPAVAGRLAGHSFLLLGAVMTMLLIPLTVQGIWNSWSMRQLGRYWKPFQAAGTYTVWGLLAVHLVLLEGFGISRANGDHFPFNAFHQRLYDYLGCSALLVVLRLPPVRRWIRRKQTAGKTWPVWLIIAPLAVVFLIAYGYFINEEFFKGIAAFKLTPLSD